MKAFVVHTDVGLPDPRTGKIVVHPRGAILAHPSHIKRLESGRHLTVHGHFVNLPDDHPSCVEFRDTPKMIEHMER